MILPKQVIENTSHVFHYRNQNRSRIIYVLIVVILSGGLISLPYLKTDIYVSAYGVIKPQVDRKQLISPNSGYVSFNIIKNNVTVATGDTLLIIDNQRIVEQVAKVNQERDLVQENISDLNYLLFSPAPERSKINAPANRSSYLKHEQQLRQLDNLIQRRSQVLKRQEHLHNEKVISSAELEKVQFEYQTALNERLQLIKDQRFLWDNERRKERQRLAELENRLLTLNRNLREFTLVASTPGTLFNTKGIELGGYLNAGEVLAEISPSSQLVAEVLLPASKVGLVRDNSEVRYQIDAYNYNNWGFASGLVTAIGKDLEIVNNQPVFKVRASLNETHLRLKNGFEGELKKGLTLRARFKVTERSLFDLLYDKVDNWLNPGQVETHAKK